MNDKGWNQQATLNLPLAKDCLVLGVEVSASVDKEGRCPQNIHRKSLTCWIWSEIFHILE